MRLLCRNAKRLMELYYMEDDEPTDYFGPVTEMAVRLFRASRVDIDGMVGMETYQRCSARGPALHRDAGSQRHDVTELQTRLREMGIWIRLPLLR
jgi:hypothetical protein